MLLEFKFGNFKSFKDLTEFSMYATNIKELEDENVIENNNLKILKSTAIFGANASGKSNLIYALGFMKNFVLNFFQKSKITDKIPIDNFKLDTKSENEPSFFEISFIQNEKKYRYGFEINKDRVISEWLYLYNSRKESMLFRRDRSNYKFGIKFKEGRGLEEKTRDNVLFYQWLLNLTVDFLKKYYNGLQRYNLLKTKIHFYIFLFQWN
jgi:uncharacterized protein